MSKEIKMVKSGNFVVLMSEETYYENGFNILEFDSDQIVKDVAKKLKEYWGKKP